MLEDAIQEINNHNASGLSFEELYRHMPRPTPPLIYLALAFCPVAKQSNVSPIRKLMQMTLAVAPVWPSWPSWLS